MRSLEKQRSNRHVTLQPLPPPPPLSWLRAFLRGTEHHVASTRCRKSLTEQDRERWAKGCVQTVLAAPPSPLARSTTIVGGFIKDEYCSWVQYKSGPVPEFIDSRFCENKPKTLVFSHWKRAFWACFRENRVYNFRHRRGAVDVKTI